MLRVLQHYLPIRTALLVLSEAILFVCVLGLGMTQHLWSALAGRQDPNFLGVSRELAQLGMTPHDALIRCVLSSVLLAVVCQIAIGFNQLYDFNVSNSRYERAARFVESAGTALLLAVGAVVIADVWGLNVLIDFPGLSLAQRLQPLVVALVAAFGLLWLWRNVYHWGMRRVNLSQRVLILGSRGPAHALARQIVEHPEAGYHAVGLMPETDDDAPSADPRAEASRPHLISSDETATAATEALVMRDVDLLSNRITNENVAMAAQPGNVPDDRSLLGLIRKLRVDIVIVARARSRSPPCARLT